MRARSSLLVRPNANLMETDSEGPSSTPPSNAPPPPPSSSKPTANVPVPQEDIQNMLKICVLGGHVGKTTMLMKYLNPNDDLTPLPTSQVTNYATKYGEQYVCIHDTPGRLQFFNQDVKSCISKSDGFVFFFDFELKETLSMILFFHEMVLSAKHLDSTSYPSILVGLNRNSENTLISESEARSKASIIEADYFQFDEDVPASAIFESIFDLSMQRKRSALVIRKMTLAGMRPRIDYKRYQSVDSSLSHGFNKAPSKETPSPPEEKPEVPDFSDEPLRSRGRSGNLAPKWDNSNKMTEDDVLSGVPIGRSRNRISHTVVRVNSFNDDDDDKDDIPEPVPKPTPIPVDTSNEIIHEGYMLKTSYERGKSQKKRYFVLKNDEIFYYTRENKKMLKGKIVLERNAEIEILSYDDFKFNIITPSLNRTWCLKCYTKQDFDSWLTTIKETTCKEANFGIDLDKVVERGLQRGSTLKVPIMIQRMINYLRDNGAVHEQGIFRISGLDTEIKDLKEKFDYEDDSEIQLTHDVHDIASSLKLYFRELPEPLVQYDIQERLLEVYGIEDVEERIEKTKTILKDLGPNYYATLDFLMHYLLDVVANKDENMMGTQNVAIVFGPTLVRNELDDPLKQFEIMEFQQRFTQDLLLYSPAIFDWEN